MALINWTEWIYYYLYHKFWRNFTFVIWSIKFIVKHYATGVNKLIEDQRVADLMDRKAFYSCIVFCLPQIICRHLLKVIVNRMRYVTCDDKDTNKSWLKMFMHYFEQTNFICQMFRWVTCNKENQGLYSGKFWQNFVRNLSSTFYLSKSYHGKRQKFMRLWFDVDLLIPKQQQNDFHFHFPC